MRGRRTPTKLVEQTKALYPLYEDYSKVARILRLPLQTTWDIINRDDNFVEYRNQQKRLLIEEAHDVAKEILRTQIRGKAAKSLAEASIAFGTLVDKTLALAGENTKWANQYQIAGKNVNISLNWKFKPYTTRKSKAKKV